jgi:deoxyribose-phosphate aldolase
MDKIKLAKMIDQTVLKADATKEEIIALCEESIKYEFACVMINPCNIKLCKEILKDSGVLIGTVIGFPLGQNIIESKVSEAKTAIENGAKEIDYVLNISELKSNNLEYIKKEMEQITKLAHDNDTICKVIIETCYLSEENIYAVCRIAAEVGIDFVKTSTGFGSAGATAEHIRLMKKTVGEKVKVKASGGVRNLEFAKELIEAGADRIGTSNGVGIVTGTEATSQY